ncbi:hypothetical protein PTKIN_Ptkin09bG0165100 [Pterospermum kingtungense]
MQKNSSSCVTYSYPVLNDLVWAKRGTSSHYFWFNQVTPGIPSTYSRNKQTHFAHYCNYGSKSKEEQWKVFCSNDDESCGISPQYGSTPAVLDLIQEFYRAINVKDIQKLDQLLSDDCVFQDLIFYIPFGGKQSLINFLQEIMDVMGQNVHFAIDDGKEGEKTTSVTWHLEWKGKEIPFTTGRNFFEFQQVDGKHIIRFNFTKITGVEEFPVKPEDLVLKLLKAVSSVFDSFPSAADVCKISNQNHFISILQSSQNHHKVADTRSQGTHEGIIKLLDMFGAYKKN